MQRKMKKTMALMLSIVMFVTALGNALPITAAESNKSFNYVMYSTSSEENSINLDCSNVCMNGSIITNGTIGYTGNFNHNGQKVISEGNEYYFVFDAINERYFETNCNIYDEDRIVKDVNVNMNKSELIYGSMNINGNVNLNASVQSMDDLIISGSVLNANNAVIMSKYGDITIESSNVSVTGLIYAPFGTVTINTSNCNLNNVIVIAHKIQIKSDNLNANYNASIGQVIGDESEKFYCDKKEWKYLTDLDGNNIPDWFENMGEWYLFKDTEKDGLPDVVEDIFGSDKTNEDTDKDKVLDFYEYYYKTNLICEDSDSVK